MMKIRRGDTVQVITGSSKWQRGLVKKVLINESKVIYVQILDNGIHWHSFIRNFQGLKGKESGKQGSVPHIHYYSNKNGTSKADFVDMIKKGNYPTAKVHIPLIDKQITSN